MWFFYLEIGLLKTAAHFIGCKPIHGAAIAVSMDYLCLEKFLAIIYNIFIIKIGNAEEPKYINIKTSRI